MFFPGEAALTRPGPPLAFYFGGSMIKAIETPYAGYRFRSRLEARLRAYDKARQARFEHGEKG